eukprot:Em0015g971a
MDETCSERCLLKIALLQFDWKSLGRRLLNTEQDVKDIDREEKEEQHKREKVLLKWKEQQGSGATYQKLYDTLKEIGNKVTAERVEQLAVDVETSISTNPQAFHVFVGVLESMPYIAALADTMVSTVALLNEKQVQTKRLDSGIGEERMSHNVDLSDEPDCDDPASQDTTELRRRKFSSTVCDDNLQCLKHITKASTEAKERLRGSYYIILKALNPSNITSQLYSAKMITSSERDSVDNTMHTMDERNTELLSAVERAVSADPSNFAKFLGILDDIPTYRPLVTTVMGLPIQPDPPGNTSSLPPAMSTTQGVLKLKAEGNTFISHKDQEQKLQVSSNTEEKHINEASHSELSYREQSSLHQPPPTVESCSLELTPKNLLNEVFANVPAKWKSIGIQLNLRESELEDIESQIAGSPNRNLEGFMLVLTKWKALRRSQYSWIVIIEALESSLVGENRLAAELRTKCKSKS